MEGAPSGSDFECVIITMENYGGRAIQEIYMFIMTMVILHSGFKQMLVEGD